MKISVRNQRKWKVNMRYKPFKSKTMKSSKRKNDLSGKYVILMNSKQSTNAALLKFISPRICKVKAALTINKAILKQTSSRFIINARRKKRFVSKIEVIGNVGEFKRLKEEYEDLFKEKEKIIETIITSEKISPTKAATQKKITPIKIISCRICNHKFTAFKFYEEHMKNEHYEEHAKTHHSEKNDSSDSENELFIDDDVELVINSDDWNNSDDSVPIPHNLKKEPDFNQPAVDQFSEVEDENLLEEIHLCKKCPQIFNSENELTLHVASSHKDEKPFKCNKCSDSYKRESGLLAHKKIAHPIEIIEPKSIGAMRARRQSVFVSAGTKTVTKKRSNSSERLVYSYKRYDNASKSFICSFCSVSLEFRYYLDRHMSVHHIKKLFICYKCSLPFDVSKLIPHLREDHQDAYKDEKYLATVKDINSVAVHRCPFCAYHSFVRSEVEEHMKNEHYDEYEKSSVDDSVSSPDSLEQLMHPETTEKLQEVALGQVQQLELKRTRRKCNDPSFKFRCVRCQRRYISPNVLRNHVCVPSKNASSVTTSEAEAKVDTVNIPQVNKMTPKPQIPMRITQKTQMVNGFFRCLSCPQVFTDRNMHNQHLVDEHSANHPNEDFYAMFL